MHNRINKFWFLMTPVVMFWYLIGRWDVYHHLMGDPDTLKLLVSPLGNKMAGICSLYLGFTILYYFIKPHLNLSFNTTKIYKILYFLYSCVTIILFIYHSYAFGCFLRDLVIGSDTIKLIDWCLDPWLLLYFTYPTIRIFFSLQKKMEKLG